MVARKAGGGSGRVNAAKNEQIGAKQNRLPVLTMRNKLILDFYVKISRTMFASQFCLKALDSHFDTRCSYLDAKWARTTDRIPVAVLLKVNVSVKQIVNSTALLCR